MIGSPIIIGPNATPFQFEYYYGSIISNTVCKFTLRLGCVIPYLIASLVLIMLSSPDVAVISCLGVLFVYHVVYVSQIYGMKSEDSLHLNVQRNCLLMDKWVIKYLQPSCTTSHHYSAIHALRNIIYVGIFLGTFTITAAFDAVLIDNINEYKLENVILGICLFASFLCWVQVVRNTNQLSVAITSMHTMKESGANNMPVSNFGQINENTNGLVFESDDQSHLQTHSKGINLRNIVITTPKLRAAHVHTLYMARNVSLYYSFAFRFLYCGIPFVFFSYGYITLYAVTIAIIVLETTWDYGGGISEYVNS